MPVPNHISASWNLCHCFSGDAPRGKASNSRALDHILPQINIPYPFASLHSALDHLRLDNIAFFSAALAGLFDQLKGMASAQVADKSTGETAPESGEAASSLPLRRSDRTRKRPSGHSEDADYENGNVVAASVLSNSRRNPKRRAAPEAFDVPERLLEASLGPWKDNEQAEWPSWVELESDPVSSLLSQTVLPRLTAR